MRNTLLVIVFMLMMFVSNSVAQELKDTTKTYPQFRLAFSYGISNDNLQKENIDGHTLVDDVDNQGVAQNGNQYQQFSDVTKPFEELTITFTARPLNDYKLLILRVGRMQNDYKYTYISEEVNSSSTVVGSLRTEITEQYTVYPLSFGFGVATHNHVAQIQAEFIYALGYMKEEFAVTNSNKIRTTSSNNYHSETMGYRFSAQLNIHFLPTVSVHLEGGYRVLGFNGFANTATDKNVGLDFSAGGVFFHSGLAIGF